MTINQIANEVRALGLTFSYSPDWKEFTINYHRHDNRRTADSDYKTTDKMDALESARVMAAFRPVAE